MHFGILGPVEVTDGAAQLTPSAHKLRVLLAVLLFGRNSVVSIDALIGELWGEDPPRTALQALRVYISQLRQLLARPKGGEPLACLVTRPPGYRLEICAEALDVLEFERLCEQGRRAADRQVYELASPQPRRALGLLRG